tara:strand:- start:191 stop:631 length:441 start_codon:yes stop_codon:yes gene_type:complete
MIKVETYEDPGDEDHPLVYESIEQLCQNTFLDQGHKEASLTLIITSDEKLRDLKFEYFNKDQYTDVIAFNLSEDKKNIDAEVYVSYDRVKDNAQTFKQSLDHELKRVIIHGILHLCGYDDDTKEKKEIMTSNEDRLIALNKNQVIA